VRRRSAGRVGPRVHRRLDLLHHATAPNHLLAAEMTAFLRKHLILELDACGAGAFQQPHRARDIDWIAKSRIGIHQNRDVDRIRDGRDVLGQLGQCDESDIGNAEAHVRDAAPVT